MLTDYHATVLAVTAVRLVDWIALALFALLTLALFVFGAVTLLDWLDNRPAQAWQQVHALLVWIDGGL